jgi:hypothetical protein
MLKGITAEYLLHRSYPAKKAIKFYFMQPQAELVKFYASGPMLLAAP